MTDPEALALVVARTGHARYQELLDPDHPDFNPGYWPVVRALAAPPWPPAAAPRPDPLALALREWWLEALALFRGDPDCGCGGK